MTKNKILKETTHKKKAPNYYIIKSDPETYSVFDLEKEGKAKWDGVHNNQALIYINNWQIGDILFVYHSLGEAKIKGVAKVITLPVKDEEDKRRSFYSWVEFIGMLPEENQISLKQVKDSGKFNELGLVKNSRLSIIPVDIDFVEWCKELCPELETLLVKANK